MYHTKVTDKNILAGNNKLFSNDEWVPAAELFGEIKVLNHSLIHEAFDRILDQHVIKQPTAFLSLCSATRPYYYSTKWKEYVKYFDNKVDFIVVSNGGMIPEEFWLSYPYLNYDAGDHEDDVESFYPEHRAGTASEIRVHTGHEGGDRLTQYIAYE